MADNPHVLHLAIASDGNPNYLLGLTVCMVSAMRRLDPSWRAVVHILDLKIPDADYAVCEAAIHAERPGAEVVRHRIDADSLEGMPRWRGSLAALNRLLLPTLLPDVDWVLYVDCDVFFTDDPSGVFNLLDGAAWIIGHEEEKSVWTEKNVHMWLDAHGYAYSRQELVNSGFLLMNLAAFRREGLSRRCFDFLARHADAPLCDQSAINVVCRGHIKLLPDRWGIIGARIPTPLDVPRGAVHFAGTAPWVSLRDRRYPDAAAGRAWLRTVWSIPNLPERWVAGLPRMLAFDLRKWWPRLLWWMLPACLVAPPWLPRRHRDKRLWRRRATPLPLDFQ